MVEIFGEPQSGKTSLANSCLQSALRNKKNCAAPWQRVVGSDAGLSKRHGMDRIRWIGYSFGVSWYILGW